MKYTYAPLPRAEMEKRRLAAIQDLNLLSSRKVARKYGVSATSAWRWARELRRGGKDALLTHKATGRPSKLSGESLAWLRKIVTAGGKPLRYRMLRDMIEEKTGVRYAEDHVGRFVVKFRKAKGAGA